MGLIRNDRAPVVALRRRIVAVMGALVVAAVLRHLWTEAAIADRFLEGDPVREGLLAEMRLATVAGSLLMLGTSWLLLRAVVRGLRGDIRGLEHARVVAEQASASKSAMLSNASHELRTPMTAILGYTEILQGDDADEDEKRDALSIIHRNGQHLLRLINDILDVAKVESGCMQTVKAPFEIRSGIRDALQTCEIKARAKGNRLDLTVFEDVPEWTVGDIGRLRQCLINLVSNASEYTSAGRIEVRVRFEHGRTPALVLEVQDEGEGIAEADLERIFQPFEQVDSETTRARTGTGLGLPLTRGLAEAMGGDLRATSERGRGSTFALQVACPPVRPEQLQFVGAPPRPADPRAARDTEGIDEQPLDTLRVLLVDDAFDNRRLYARMLQRAGARVAVATGGMEAIDKALRSQRAADPFDVVLMDVQMPEVDGVEALRTLRAAGYGRPILALTAHVLEQERQGFFEAGFDAVLGKPIRKTELVSEVERWARPSAASGTDPISGASSERRVAPS